MNKVTSIIDEPKTCEECPLRKKDRIGWHVELHYSSNEMYEQDKKKDKLKMTDKQKSDGLIELLKKAEPQKPFLEGDGYSDGELVYDTCICETCGTRYELEEFENYKYCPDCGQKIDLSWMDDME